MTDTSTLQTGRFALPRPQKLTLRNFSLYDNASVIEAEFIDGVFCLAGANGLGKSTFLAALNYAITGIVPDPNRRFESTAEYYRKSQSYSAEFFRGRIEEADSETAQVELEMLVGTSRYRIVRGMFDPIALREVEVWSSDGTQILHEADLSADDSERHSAYEKAITRDVGLDSFAQLVFLQHFVLTFDERRHLLFWDDRVAQTALYIAFGVDAERAAQADNLRRTAERADSLARNLQWQATDLRKRLKDLQDALSPSGPQDSDVVDRHRQLLEDLEETAARLHQFEEQGRDARLRIADVRAQLAAAIEAYEFSYRVLLGGAPAHSHPVVATAAEHALCSVCGSEGPSIAEVVRRRLADNLCPLCNSSLTNGVVQGSEGESRELEEGEARVSELQSVLASEEATVARLDESAGKARVEAEALAAQVGAFEKENDALLLRASSANAAAPEAVSGFQTQIAELMSRKRQQLDRRNAARGELKTLQDGLTTAYADAEATFVPRFTELAREFLGLDLEIRLQTQAAGVGLLLTVQGTTRRVADSLSESQRFFVDIALRMALAQQMTSAGSAACLYVDTPEGSLDIAYESRAGSMFGQFVRSGGQLIMTANINTSQLLKRLASTCGHEQMALLRMTEWTSLSEVQSSEESLFDQAYADIESALEAGG